MPPGAVQVTDVDEGTVLNFVPFALAPETFIAQLVVHPILWTVDSSLYAMDVTGCESGGGWGEGVCDMMVEAMVGIGMGKAACRLVEDKAFVHQLFSCICDTVGSTDNSGTCCTMVGNFCA